MWSPGRGLSLPAPREKGRGMHFDGSMAGAFKGFIEVLGLALQSQTAFLGYGLRKGEPEVVGRTKPACAGHESPHSCPSRADAASLAEGIPAPPLLIDCARLVPALSSSPFQGCFGCGVMAQGHPGMAKPLPVHLWGENVVPFLAAVDGAFSKRFY